MKSELEQKALLSELESLNAEVTAVLAKRKAWMDAHMADFAKVQVGEEIWDLRSVHCLGTVSKLYRYWGDHNPLYDTSMSVCYQYHTGNNIYDNTSRQSLWIGTKDDAQKETEYRLRPKQTYAEIFSESKQ